MVNIYLYKENLPKDLDLIDDPDKAIFTVPMVGSGFQRLIIQEVEQGEYKDDTVFKDRFGNCLYYSDLSTGSKIMLLLEAFPKKVIRCDEVGDNAFRFITRLKECNAYFSIRSTIIDYEKDVPASLNGVGYASIGDINCFL